MTRAAEATKRHIVAHWYEYTLRVVDRFGNLDAKFPELPSVRSKKQFQRGATVTIGLAYGDLSPDDHRGGGFVTGLNDTDIRLTDDWQLTQAADGGRAALLGP